MVNHLILVGRIKKIFNNNENNENEVKIILETRRSYKNLKGEYDVDLITIIVNRNLVGEALECCKPGELIGIKGRIETRLATDNEGFTIDNALIIVAEKITFLSNGRGEK